MACLIPESVRRDKGVPSEHRRVGSALAIGLDDDATAWFEPPFDPDGRRPDFVVLDPSLGVIVLMVFGQVEKDQLLGALRGELRVERQGDERVVEDPLGVANSFGIQLRAAIAGCPQASGTPVGGVAVFPHLDRPQAEEFGIDTVLDLDRCLFKADLDAVIKDENEMVLVRRFRAALEGGLDEALEGTAVDELRAVIQPDLVIAEPVSQGSLFSAARLEDGDAIKVMDRKQERMAKSLGAGHRIIRGVAGSGKTLVLVHRARTLARLMPHKRVLVTCYTRSLASQLRAQLDDLPNVEVVHLNVLMSKVIRNAGLQDPSQKREWDKVPGVALEAIKALDGHRYQAVMIDEAQDFDTTALEFCVELLEANDPDQQDLVIVADSAQNIYRRNFRWKDAGIKAQGRTRILRVNYRNTKEILEFAHGFLTADPIIGTEEAPDQDDELTIIPAESAERSGPKPTVTVTGDAAGEIAAVVEQVKGWYSHRLRARSIAVLMASERAEDRGERLVQALEEAEIPVFWVTDRSQPANRDLAGSADEPVIVSTIHSAKGLEFPRVVVCGLAAGGGHNTERSIADRKTLYVGFTRAVEELAVVTTSDNPFAKDLL